MSGINITRDEAQQRSSTVAVESYDVRVDLTGRDETFPSTTTVTFSARPGGSTWIDYVAPTVSAITLNGQTIDPGLHDGFRIPLADLKADNTLVVVGESAYMNTGEGLHRFIDPVDDEVYLYTQFEIADARRVFACFDQPDLKATFAFTVTAPAHWKVVSNSATPAPESTSGGAVYTFAPTPRMSTYITAIVVVGVGASLVLEESKIAAVIGLVSAALTALIAMLNGIAGATAKQEKPEFQIIQHLIDKLDRLGPDGVRQLLGEGRKDESGDFTKGAGLSLQAIDTIMSFSLGGQSAGAPAFDLFGLLGKSEIGAQGAEELLQIEDLARDAGYGPDRIRIDPSVVRGLEYYTGPVFEAELTFEVKGEDGRPIRFGSVGGGGRYDDLVARFTGEVTPATDVLNCGLCGNVCARLANTSATTCQHGACAITTCAVLWPTPGSFSSALPLLMPSGAISNQAV